MPLKATRWSLLIYAVQLFQCSFKSRLGLWLSASATAPITVGLVELRGCTDMITVLFALICYKLTDAIHRWFIFSDLVFNDLWCLQFIRLPSRSERTARFLFSGMYWIPKQTIPEVILLNMPQNRRFIITSIWERHASASNGWWKPLTASDNQIWKR